MDKSEPVTRSSDEPRPSEALSAPRTTRGSDLPRYEGRLAEIAHFRAVLEDARGAEDRDREREACVALAHLYAQRGTDLDAAVALAKRALSIADESPLRAELAGWLAGLGDPGSAALELRGSVRTTERTRGRTLVRTGVLLARAGKADAAALLFAEASELDPSDAIPEELVGTLSAWAEEVMPRRQGALAFVEAARRREAAGQPEAALEDLFRAFELCPTEPQAVNGVVKAIEAQGRKLAADEILRDAATALEHEDQKSRAVAVHGERAAAALEAGDLERALGAVLDLGEAGGFEQADYDSRIDEVLARTGLSELLAARMERRARSRTGPARADDFEALARFYAGTLGSDDRAIHAFIEAASADPERRSATDALRGMASHTGDYEPLVEALVRVVGHERAPVALALELAEIADQHTSDPFLGDWALERARSLDPAQGEAVESGRARLEPALAERAAEIARAEALAEGQTGDAASRDVRIEAKRKLVRLYGKSPLREESAIAALAAFVKAEPSDAGAARSLRFFYGRAPDDDTRSVLYESVLRARLEARLPRRDETRVRADLAWLVSSDGSGRKAMDELVPLLEGEEPDSYGTSLVLEVAFTGAYARQEARALAALAHGLDAKIAAVLSAASADAYRRAGALADARKVSERALDLDPSCTRAASALARVAAVTGGRDAAIAIERALGVVVPRAWLCDALARSLESIGEHDLAFAWTQRWLGLSPGDRRAIAEFLRRCQLGTDPARIAEALNWVLAQPDPPDGRITLFLDALVLLFGLDKALGGQVARRALDVFGPGSAELRERLGALADEHSDAGLAIALLERTIASDPEAPREVLIELAQRRMAVGDFDSAARELLRAQASGVDEASVYEALLDLEKDSGGGLGSDGVVALFELKAKLFAAILADVGLRAAFPQVDAGRLEAAWRALGSTRWDLAQDPRGSEQALFAAAECTGMGSFELYAQDLAELAGPERAVAAIVERLGLIDGEPPEKRVQLALAAARLAAEHGLASWALDAALAALAIEPANAEAIAMAESQAPHVDGGEAAIDHIYDALARAAMGMFGRRAAHYRAARQLERLGSKELALKHALAAFEAVPTEGTSWLLLTRLVDAETGSADAVSLFQRVADKAKGEERSGWFKRAVELSGTDRPGLVRRFDVLVRALETIPEFPFAISLRETTDTLAADGGLPDDAPDRLRALTEKLLGDLAGPDGARTLAQLSLALARAGLEPETFRALRKAIEIDGELEVFDRIREGAALFGSFIESATELVAFVEQRMANKLALTGPPLLRLASAIADSLSDSRASAALLEEAERRDTPEAEADRESRHSLHDDPFADPAMFDSAPPPSAAAVPSDPPADIPEAPLPPAEEPPPEPIAAEAILDLGDSTAPAAIPSARRSASGTQTPAVRDGFDALFDETGELARNDELEQREAEARERGDHEAVSELLLERIVASSWTDQVRVLKLRRAAVLEQRLERTADAQKELEEVLAESPNDKSALSFLADMLERRGENEKAAPLYERLSELPDVEAPESARFALSAARAHLAAGDHDAALRVVDSIPEAQADRDVHRFRLDLMRAKGDMFSLVLAIDQMLAAFEPSEMEAAELLVEACRAASAAGDEQGALIRARRAARLAPELPDATLECARLEYRSRGMGTPRDAQAVVETLNAVAPYLQSEHIELHTFLLAEALDVIQGGGAGLRELSHRHAEVGPLPLIALGMAERLSRGRSFEAAVPLYEIAMDGDLRGLRNRARVALGAADAAIHAGMLEAANGFIEIAERSPETRPQIAKRRRELLAYDKDPKVARPVLEQLVLESGGITKARYLQQLARITTEDDFEIAMALFEEALVLARRDRPLADKIRSELIELIESRGITKAETIPAPEPAAVESDPPPSAGVSSSMRPDSAARPALNPTGDDEPPIPPARSKPPPLPPPLPAGIEEVAPLGSTPALVPPPLPEPIPVPESEPARAARPRGPRLPPAGPLAPAARPLFIDDREESLFAELVDGYVEAGDDLIDAYALSRSARARDVLIVRRHQAALKPGHRPTLDALHAAAVEERDDVYARALDHVRAVESGAAPSPPPLYAQPREPDLLSALLFRDVASRESEVLAIVWEAGMFRKELASYGVGAADRVPLTAGSVLGEAYSEIAAHLASPRALFHTKSDAPLELGVALLAQPALLASGDVRAKTPELVYQIAAAHAAAAPELVLSANLPEPILRRLFEALDAAFGPVRPRDDDAPASSTDAFKADVARIAGELWQRVNPRSERRLRELCEGEPLLPERARTSAQRAMRRAGLYASGDLGLALQILADTTGQPSLAAVGEGALEAACHASDDAADLVRLATRVEYAEARWQLPAPGSVRRG